MSDIGKSKSNILSFYGEAKLCCSILEMSGLQTYERESLVLRLADCHSSDWLLGENRNLVGGINLL